MAPGDARGPDPDFSRAVLEDLYAYPRKRPFVAWLLWALLGWAGAHRLYLDREFTGLIMLFTGGGALLWWGVDGFLVGRMVRRYNREQDARQAAGRPPIGLDAMPAMDGVDVEKTPAWVARSRERSRSRRRLHLVGDTLVLVLSGAVLGALAGSVEGAFEATTAVLLLAGLTMAGQGPGWLEELPVARGLQRWNHRVRLFYRHYPPGSPVLLLLRPVVGLMSAPFRARDRAEVRLYVELGAAFTTFFLLLDVIGDLAVPALMPGREVSAGAFLAGWVGEVINTFFLVYAFATPVGAVLTRRILVDRTHTLPRLLSGLAVLSILAGLAAAPL